MKPIPKLTLTARRGPEHIKRIVGKVIDPDEHGSYLQLAGPCRLEDATGKLLACYLPQVISPALSAKLWPVLSPIKVVTDTRVVASGSEARFVGEQRRGNQIHSATIGSLEAAPGERRNAYCRLTEFDTTSTLFHVEAVQEMFALINAMAKTYEPARYAAQLAHAKAIHADWIILGTPWSTLTVNNTYPTGVHKDAGDLDAGVSCLLCLRRGLYSGGHLTLPEYGAAVDLQDGDLLLMDAHEWHGNTRLDLRSDDAERVSVVFYLRTLLTECGTAVEEQARQDADAARQAVRREAQAIERGEEDPYARAAGGGAS